MEREPLFRFTSEQAHFGKLAVKVFFVISGFLITASYERSRNLRIFARARALRIFPGLTASVIMTAFIIGPLVTTLPLWQYFSSADTYLYLKAIILRNHDLLPGVFEHNAYRGPVNGSLWTLFYEALCYCVVAFLGITHLLKSWVVLVVFVAAQIVFLPENWTWHRELLNTFLTLFAPFSAGMLFYIFRDRIRMSPWILAVCIGALLGSSHFTLWNRAFPLFGTYIILYLAFTPGIKLNDFAARGDMSYGLYIYAFPAQQCVTQFFGGKMNPMVNFAIALPVTLVCAYLSWNLVEKRFLKMKPKPPVVSKPSCGIAEQELIGTAKS